MSDTPVIADDGLARCPWGAAPAEYRAYHDTEWGRPEGDDDRVFELVCLEGFQAGLSWWTILRKRPAFRAAFAGFVAAEVAAFTDRDVARLVADAGIVRHRGKILATIANARATVALREQNTSLAALIWAHETEPGPPAETLAELPSTTPAATACSRALRRAGFGFVGPTTLYSAFQALGVVNDHLAGCHVRVAAVTARAGFVPPAAPACP